MVAIKAPYRSMRHLNGDLLVAVDIETTGSDPKSDEIIQIGAVIADDYLYPNKKVMPFYMTLIPSDLNLEDNPDTRKAGLKAADFKTRGEDRYTAAELFVEWYDRLGLHYTKQLQPIYAYSPKVIAFLIEWLGKTDYDRIFSNRVRDIITFALHLNDRSNFTAFEYPCPKIGQSHLATRFGVTNERPGDALQDALAILETYRRMVGQP